MRKRFAGDCSCQWEQKLPLTNGEAGCVYEEVAMQLPHEPFKNE